MNEFNFLSTKQKQRNFSTCNLAFSSFLACDNRIIEGSVIENGACDKRPPKLNMKCVDACTCDCMHFKSRPNCFLIGVTEPTVNFHHICFKNLSAAGH